MKEINMLILGIIIGLILSLLVVISIYVFRSEIHTYINKNPLKQKGELLDLEEPKDKINKLFKHGN